MEYEEKGILFVDLQKGQEWKTNRRNCSIILIGKGRLNISSLSHKDERISAGKIFLIPTGYETEVKAVEESALISIDISEEINQLTHFQSDRTEENDNNQNLYLPFNEIVSAYIESLQTYKDIILDYNPLARIKIKELIYILKVFYTQKELNAFFSSYITNDLHFSEQVKILSQDTKNIRQLAEIMNYSYSGFNRRFRRSFGVSAYSWLRKRRANLVYHDIYYTNKSLKQISTENMFSTLSHFNEFCHKNLGNSPSEIRRKKRPLRHLLSDRGEVFTCLEVANIRNFLFQNALILLKMEHL
ncbi:helix-turn-helix domain-containing protein [Dysgonomonas sp. 520]|uniref:helix-turn-helix domain-containing protein n=1 Tax=Dysgonomonas sp. 520 TaxID=2302931 RepID=UPI0013D23890|nr:helix-turn-helix domain-containing protein [Dysgonomonas sp. 520]NDW10570.1 AraC family transcriptional regulator [Dysgonomonas sp. 520]